jgi:hypothetical protein
MREMSTNQTKIRGNRRDSKPIVLISDRETGYKTVPERSRTQSGRYPVAIRSLSGHYQVTIDKPFPPVESTVYRHPPLSPYTPHPHLRIG